MKGNIQAHKHTFRLRMKTLVSFLNWGITNEDRTKGDRPIGIMNKANTAKDLRFKRGGGTNFGQ